MPLRLLSNWLTADIRSLFSLGRETLDETKDMKFVMYFRGVSHSIEKYLMSLVTSTLYM